MTKSLLFQDFFLFFLRDRNEKDRKTYEFHMNERPGILIFRHRLKKKQRNLFIAI